MADPGPGQAICATTINDLASDIAAVVSENKKSREAQPDVISGWLTGGQMGGEM